MFKRQGTQGKKGASYRPFFVNFPTPDISQGLPGLSAPQRTLNGNKVYPCRAVTPGQGHQEPAALPGQQPFPLDGRQLELRLYPGLSTAALKGGDDKKELALWYELRAINANGSSRLVLNEAVAALVEHFDYTQSTAYRLLRAGVGKFWEIKGSSLSSGFRGRSVIKIYSLLQVAEYFNTYPGRPTEVRVSDFKGRQVKTAQLYASFFKPDGSRAKPISRASIELATGVGRRQQRRYDQMAGIKRVPHFVCQYDSQGKLVPVRHLVSGKSRQWLKDRRLGNSYNSRALKAPRGMTKKVNAELRHRSYNQDEASGVLKRFFLSARSYLRSSERANEPFLLVRKRDRLIPGRMEWCMV